MKITYRWLQDFTPVGVPVQELAAQLTMAGLEVESVEAVAPPFSDVVVGEVIECSRHPHAEKLAVCQVSTDGSNRLQIICGAANVRAGLKVAVAMIGARLPNDVHIERAELRGLESHGMLCSARELGLGEEHGGILELDAALPLNQNLRDALLLDDAMLQVNATPNRGDCMSVFGIARDYAAARERRYLSYRAKTVASTSASSFPVTLASPSCPKFAARVIGGVKANARAPAWLRERLRRVGINSISGVVDVTNYVMMELGQPMHAYDLAKLRQGITVRAALGGERVTLLDDKEYVLDSQFLVIADGAGPVGLAGVMGGRRTAISAATTEVMLESAHFTPEAIAGRARKLGLFTDAAQRYERGVDPTLPEQAIERATELLLQCAGGEPGPVQVTRGAAAEPVYGQIALRRARLTRLLGVEVPAGDVHSVLAAISARMEETTDGWRITKPPHRFDLCIEADLIEEVARLRGFDAIEEIHASAPQLAGAATESRVGTERLLHAMADRGYREAISYTFVDPALQRQMFPDKIALAIENPIAADLAEMRVSLWPGLVQACRDNLRRQQPRVRLFEIGKKFLLPTAQTGGALREIESLAGIAIGTRLPEQWGSAREPLDFYDIKDDVAAALALTGSLMEFRFEPEALTCLRPGRAARIYRGANAVGWIGELHPQLLKSINFSQTAYVFDIEIDVAFYSNHIEFKDISKFPLVRRDLAVVVDESVPFAVLRENVTVSASGLLRQLRIFDVYRSSGVETGRKSIALGLILQDSSRTLTDVDADAVVAKVVARLRDVLSATIRDQ